MGIFLTRFVSKPDLALHPVPVNIGSMVRPDNCDNPVLIFTGSSGLSCRTNDRVLMFTGYEQLSGLCHTPDYPHYRDMWKYPVIGRTRLFETSALRKHPALLVSKRL
jgi:hypothetical protein